MDSSEQTRFDELANDLIGLSTCEARVEWERRAEEESSGINSAIQSARVQIAPVIQERADMVRALERAKFDFGQQPFLKRIFGDHSAEKTIKARISVIDQWLMNAQSEIAQFQEISSQLYKLLYFVAEFGPKTMVEKRQIIDKLHLQKKELQIRKREISTTATAIRREARTASVGAGKSWLGLYDSSLAANQRRGIRAAKENALHPYESEKADIEKQMIELDKHILFVEQFKS